MTHKVLVVDDEPLMVRSWVRLFGTLGCETSACFDGLTALEHLKKESFDVLVTDLRMPYFTGYDLLTALGDLRHPPERIFVCSAYIEDDDSLSQFNVTGVIPKPFNVREQVAFFRQLFHSSKKGER